LFRKAYILKIGGIKFNPKGYIIDKTKLNKVSSIKIIWVFINIEQKQETKIQKNIIRIKIKRKNIINLIFKFIFNFFNFSKVVSIFFSFFISKKFASDKANFLNIKLIIEDIIAVIKIFANSSIKLYIPLSSYTLWILLSPKKNPLIEKYKENENIANDIFTVIIL